MRKKVHKDHINHMSDAARSLLDTLRFEVADKQNDPAGWLNNTVMG
jgi:hypothetical protein